MSHSFYSWKTKQNENMAVCIPYMEADEVPYQPFYKYSDFTFDIWVNLSKIKDATVASNYIESPAADSYNNPGNYGWWYLDINGSTYTLTFRVACFIYDQLGGQSTGHYYKSYDCELESPTVFRTPNGELTAITIDRWYRLTIVREGFVQRIYIDGDLAIEKDFSYVFQESGFSNTRQLFCGSTLPGSDLHLAWDPIRSGGSYDRLVLPGYVDEARLWNRALSKTDIRTWTALVPPNDLPGLLGRWGFDKESKEKEKPWDATGNNLNCSFVQDRQSHPKFDDPGFLPPTPQTIQLNNNNSVHWSASYNKNGYLKLASDCSLETWLCLVPDQQGAILSIEWSNCYRVLFIADDGKLTFYNCNKYGQERSVTTDKPTGLLDGEWHHVAGVCESDRLVLYVDGRPLATCFAPALAMEDIHEIIIRLGESDASSRFFGNDFSESISGRLDELRVWNTSRSIQDIADGLFHSVEESNSALALYCNFDCGDTNDLSSFGHWDDHHHDVSFDDSPFDFNPPNSPYILSQTLLMQEWTENGSLEETTTYRVILSPRNFDHSPRTDTSFTLWATEDVDICCQGSTYSLSLDSLQTLPSNAKSKCIFTIKAKISDRRNNKDDQLYCPGIYVRCDFMDSHEQILVSPDRQLHHTLATITGAELRNGRGDGRAGLLSNEFSDDQANAIADAVNDVALAGLNYRVQSRDESTNFVRNACARPVVKPSYPSARLERDMTALEQGFPISPRYMSTKLSVANVNPKTRAIATNYLPLDTGVFRKPDFAYRTEKIAAFNFTDRTYTAVDPDDLQARLAACKTVYAITPSTTRGVSPNQFATAGHTSLWDDFVNGVLDIADAVVETVEDALHELQVTLYTTSGDAIQWALDSAEEIFDYVKGLFNTLLESVTEIIDYCKTVFDWDQYKNSSLFLNSATSQIYNEFQSLLHRTNQYIDSEFASWKEPLKDAVRNFVQNPTVTGSVNDNCEFALVQPEGDVQSNYLSDLVSDSLDSIQVTNVGSLPDADFSNFTLPDPNQNQGFQNLLKRFAETVTDVNSIVIEELMALLFDLIDFVFDCGLAIIDFVFEFLESFLETIWRLLNTELVHIPLLTTIIKEEMGIAWTPLGLANGLAGVAATIAYKSFAGLDAVLVDSDSLREFENNESLKNLVNDFVDALTSTNTSNFSAVTVANDFHQRYHSRAKNNSYDWMKKLGYVFAGGFSIGRWIWCGIDLWSDGERYLKNQQQSWVTCEFQSPSRIAFNVIKLAIPTMTVFCSMPIGAVYKLLNRPTGAEQAQFLIEGSLYGIPALRLCFGWTYAFFNLGKVPTLVPPMVFGIFQILGIVPSAAIDFVATDYDSKKLGFELSDAVLKIFQTLSAAYPSIGKGFFLVPQETNIDGVPVGYIVQLFPFVYDVGHISAGGINLLRLGIDVTGGLAITET